MNNFNYHESKRKTLEQTTSSKEVLKNIGLSLLIILTIYVVLNVTVGYN